MPTAAEGRRGSARTPREGVWRVDDLLVDAGRRVVRRGDQELPVSGISLDVLLALIGSAPNLLSNDELMDRVWGSVVVSPETLTQRIKLLRDSIGDDARQPRYVLGVRGRGYRLVPLPLRIDAAVTTADTRTARAGLATAPEAPAQDSAPGLRSGQDRRGRPAHWPLAALAMLAIAALAWWAWRMADEPTGAPPAGSQGVAVLPFENVDGGEAGAALAIGVTEALLHRLASLDGVKVISRYSAVAAGAAGHSPEEIGRRLDARYLLEGSVQTGGQRLRVRTALTDVSDGRQLWSLQFDRRREDLLAIQDEIAAKVARTFASSTQSGIAEGAGRVGTSSAAAQHAFLQGNALVSRMVVADVAEAVSLFDTATRIDPAFASAHAAAAGALLTLEELRDEQRLRQRPAMLEEAERRVATALAADRDNGEALVVRARIAALRGDYPAAERDFAAGLVARPNDADAHLQYARFLFYGLDPFEQPASAEAAARSEERYRLALRHCERAAQLDPLSPMARFFLGQMTLHLGDPVEADRYLAEAIRLDPNLPPALGRMAQVRWLSGELADAVLYGERALTADPDAGWIRRMVSQYYVEFGELDAAERVLEEGGADLSDGRLAVLLRQRRWREAGELALADSQRQPRSYDRDLASFALRDRARHDPADAGRILVLLRSRIAWKQVGEWRVLHHGSRFPALAAAELLSSRGDRAEGQALVEEVARAIEIDGTARVDERVLVPLRQDRRSLALALAMQGRDAEALGQLEVLVRERALRHLWYDLEIQPVFDGLRGESRFTSLLDAYRAQVRREREKLAALRAQGALRER